MTRTQLLLNDALCLTVGVVAACCILPHPIGACYSTGVLIEWIRCRFFLKEKSNGAT